MLFIGLTMLGYVSYKKLAVELIPNAQLPACSFRWELPLKWIRLTLKHRQ